MDRDKAQALVDLLCDADEDSPSRAYSSRIRRNPTNRSGRIQRRALDVMERSVELLEQLSNQLGNSISSPDPRVSPRTQPEVGEITDTATNTESIEQRLRRELVNWQDESHQAHQNARFYRGILENIAHKLGPDVHVQNDGGISENILIMRIPEVLDDLLRRAKSNG